MTAFDLLFHLLNFAAPAFFVALLLAVLYRLALRPRGGAPALWLQCAVTFAAGLAVLAIGLWYFGRDGRIATYAALVLVCGSVQWWMARGWK